MMAASGRTNASTAAPLAMAPLRRARISPALGRLEFHQLALDGMRPCR